MAKQIQAIRGMNDCLPEQSPVWQKVEQILRQVVASYGYSEVRMPIVEQTHLFKRAIGEVTDVVEKEMYTFEDRNGDSLSLRPEGTASCVRAGIEHGLLYNQERRMWYMGPMFRHERPQKGRYRQFHQFGVELFGINGPDIDAELIMLTHRLWRLFGISDHVTLQLNTLGQSNERAAYRDALVAYLEQFKSELDEESQRRMYSNPLRVLDSKDEKVQAILAGAPRLFDHLGEESLAHFEGLKRLLTAAGIQFEVNERLVRGLDYYTGVIYEAITALSAPPTKEGAPAQRKTKDNGELDESTVGVGSIAAGGRYDHLVGMFCGAKRPDAVPCVGVSIGVERVFSILLQRLQEAQARGERTSVRQKEVDVYVMSMGDGLLLERMQVCKMLWDAGIKAEFLYKKKPKLQQQFAVVDKEQIPLAVLLAPGEWANGTVRVKQQLGKDEAGDDKGTEVPLTELAAFVQTKLSPSS